MLSHVDIVRRVVSENTLVTSLLTPHSRLLARHPNVLAKLRGEIKSIVGLGEASRVPDRNTLKKMKYLNLVFKEGMDDYGPTPVL